MEQLKTIRNGERVRPTFSAGEMNRRLEALRAHMAERQIDACLFTSIHNIHYFSDFLYCSFGRTYGLVVTQDGQTTISANIDGGQPWRRTFGDNIAYTDWHRDNYFVAVKQLIRDGSRVGIEARSHHRGEPAQAAGCAASGGARRREQADHAHAHAEV